MCAHQLFESPPIQSPNAWHHHQFLTVVSKFHISDNLSIFFGRLTHIFGFLSVPIWSPKKAKRESHHSFIHSFKGLCVCLCLLNSFFLSPFEPCFPFPSLLRPQPMKSNHSNPNLAPLVAPHRHHHQPEERDEAHTQSIEFSGLFPPQDRI